MWIANSPKNGLLPSADAAQRERCQVFPNAEYLAFSLPAEAVAKAGLFIILPSLLWRF